MDTTPWISAYEPKEWDVYELEVDSCDYRILQRQMLPISQEEIFVCAAESESAKRRWQQSRSLPKNTLFFDIEQIWSMNLDKAYGMDLRRLMYEWRGHPAGSLVFVSYRGVDKTPSFLTIGVEKNS